MGSVDPPASPSDPGDAGTGVRRATGRDRDEWFRLLDAWGAPGRPYRQVAAWLADEHGLSTWWAQKLIVEYEQARGLRAPGVRPGGTFTITVSRTVNVPVERLYAAFVDPDLRERWLPGAVLRERTARPGRSVRFDWEDGATRVNVTFDARSPTRATAGLEHTGLPDGDAATATKAFWQRHLTALKALLEG